MKKSKKAALSSYLDIDFNIIRPYPAKLKNQTQLQIPKLTHGQGGGCPKPASLLYTSRAGARSLDQLFCCILKKRQDGTWPSDSVSA